MTSDQELAYKASSDLYNKEIDRLFQRFNFFLIGTSFLIVAFVTLLKGALCFGSISFVFFYLINFAGFFLSIFFTLVNFYMTRFLGEMSTSLYELETKFDNAASFPFHLTKELGKNIGEKPADKSKEPTESTKRGCCYRIRASLRNCNLICEFRIALCEVIRKKFAANSYTCINEDGNEKTRRLLAQHIWLVPFGFIHFWWVAALLSTLCRCGIIHP